MEGIRGQNEFNVDITFSILHFTFSMFQLTFYEINITKLKLKVQNVRENVEITVEILDKEINKLLSIFKNVNYT